VAATAAPDAAIDEATAAQASVRSDRRHRMRAARSVWDDITTSLSRAYGVS
jgi:hypothetical protein